MARKRMIDPKIWDSEQVMSLSSDEFKVYIFLITQADDYGRLKVSYSLFCKHCFPLNQECDIPLMKNIIIKLSEIDLIEIYTDGRYEYIQHPNWDKYQKISHPAKPLIPSREECAKILKKQDNPPESSGGFRKTPEDSGETPEDSGRFQSLHPRIPSTGEASPTIKFSLDEFNLDKFSLNKENSGKTGSAPPPASPPEVNSPPSKNHQSRDGPLGTDQIGPDGKKLLSAEDIQKEKERQKKALKDKFPDNHKAHEKELPQ